MFRGISVLACLIGAAVAASGDDDKDPIREKLFAAKVAYDKEMSQIRGLMGDWLDKREESARKAGDRKLVDQVKSDRRAFDEDGDIPKNAPTGLAPRQDKAKKTLEAAYSEAVKAYTKAKQDDRAAVVEKELLEFRLLWKWKNVDLSKVKTEDDHVRIPPNATLPTIQKFTAFELVVVARTESENIRLDGPQGTAVIFNWEVNPRELRVTRPDGTDRVESGSLATAKVTPLKPNTWYTLKWRVTEDGMQISVDGQVVFEEKRKYQITTSAPVVVRAIRSNLDVKDIRVTPIGK
jgi:hypothetical protein